VIGSMGPDLFYYVPLPISREYTHSLTGVFTVDLALGIVGFFLWQLVFRRPLFDFMPLYVRRKLASLRSDGIRPRGAAWWKVALLIIASVLLGTLTHVFWDSFTHAGATVSTVGWLQQQWGPLPAYRWAQYFSSVFGAVAVVWWAAVWLRRARSTDAAPTRLTSGLRIAAWVCLVIVGVGVFATIWVHGLFTGLSALNSGLLFRSATVAIACAGLVAIGWTIAWWVRRSRAAPLSVRSSAEPR
jgi:hypothetical protein